MLFGVDTSGKIGEGNIYIAVVEHRNSNFLPLLRDVVRKRHRALASRKRVKGSELTEKELDWIVKNFDSRFSASFIGINAFSNLRDNLLATKDWKLKILASAIFLTSKNAVNSDDVILVDRDYSEDVMERLFSYLKMLFKINGKNPIFETGTSFNDAITKADLIARCARKGKIKMREFKQVEIIRLVRML